MFEKITKTLSGLAFIKYINSLIDYVNTSDIDATRIKGQLDISNIPPAGLDNVIKVDTVTDMLALTVDDVQNGDTVMIIGVTPPVQYQVVDDTKLGTMDAFQEYAAGTATKALADINGNNIHTTYGKLAGNNTWTGNNYWNGSAIFNANLNIRGSATTPGDASVYLWLGLKPEGSEQTPSIARNKIGDLVMYAADYRPCYLRSGIQTCFASVYNSDGTVEFSSLNNTPWGKYTNANGLELTVHKTPTVNNDVSNKKYVDDSVASATADLLSSNNMWTGTNTYNRNIYITNGSSAGSSGTLYLGVKPTNETVQARIGTDKLGGLFYHASTNQPHVFRVGTNNNVFVIHDDDTKVTFSSNNIPFATVTHDGVAKWLGNANTATKLQTARTINGVSFDGTANITIADSTKLPIAGGTMTGDLTLKGNPTADLMAATKKYVDDSIANGDVNSAKYLNITNFIPSNSDFNDYKTPGEYQVQSNTEANTIANLPTSYNDATPRGGVLSVLIGFNAPRTSLVQIYRTYGSSYVVSRTYQRCLYHENSSWTAWREIACTDEVGLLNQANTFTALNTFRANIAVSSGTTAGSQGQIILGNKPQSATVQANIIASTTGALNYIATENTGHYFKIGNNTASTSITTNESETAIFSHNAIEFARITNVGVAKWLGNANTATKLQTARTINGVSFDGTANITIADSTKLPIAGGTMTGDLTLKGNPTADLMAATKKYVDDSVASAGGGDVLAAGNNSFTGANTFQNLVTMVGGVVFTSGTTTLAWKNATQIVATINASTYTGNSATATKLATARTITANLASSTAGSFDGSANITVGVTGTLPIANGGTGATTAAAARTALGCAPAYTYSTTDLTAGSSALTTGTLYIVYE
jgi:hypothetical protein